MKRVICALAIAAGLVAGHAPAVAAQGVQTGTLSGAVLDQQGLALPGVTVTASSPALQGERVTATDANGLYTMPALPPGAYTVQFDLQGMTRVRRETIVPLGGVAPVDVRMMVGGIEEVVQVTAEAPGAPLATPTGQANLAATETDRMPVGRTPARLAELAPGLTDNAPQAGQVTISGAFGYDNVFMIDGVDVNDNIFGFANDVFIEDAVEEVQVLTSGIAAEYGRFSGGVVNLITKRGGNVYSGSVRLNLTNPAWSRETPFEQSKGTERESKLSKFLEGTLGGPLVKDRLWFFGATRRERSDAQGALAFLGTPFVTETENDRYEIKLTGTPADGHQVQGSYVDSTTKDNHRASLSPAASLDSNVFINRQTPQSLFVTNYNGVVGSRTLVSAQYSRREYGQRNNGGTSTDLFDSPFRSRGALSPGGLHYHAPMLSAHDPQDRNNRQFSGSLTYFLTTRSTGSHSVKVGGEHFTSTLVGGNSQSATGYVFLSDYLVADATGAPVVDAEGRIVPQFVPGLSQVQHWMSSPGARIDIKTVSLYAQDQWALTNRLSLDLGVRMENVTSDATGDIVGADTGAIVPRLGVSFDPTGSGLSVVQATYAHYSGKYGEAQFVRNTDVGNPSRVTYAYTGPAGAGFDFAPGMDLANYAAVVSGSFPTANVSFADDLSSPLTKEFTLSTGRELGRGYARVMYTWRRASNFIEDYIDDPSADGKVQVVREGVNFGTFDRVVYRNNPDAWREYQALQFTGRYPALDNLHVNGHYTVQLENNGNFEGEAANQPGLPSEIGDWPELFSASRSYPEGRLDDFQRHKIRLWAVYTQSLGRAGSVDVAPLWRYNSGRTYSIVAAPVALSAEQLAANPGYARLPSAQALYFGERGSGEFPGYGLVDLAATYQVPVWRTLRPWLKFEMFNVLNNQKVTSWNTSVTVDPASPVDALGLPTGYLPAAGYGTPRSNADYPRPLPGVDGGRTFQVAFGLRF